MSLNLTLYGAEPAEVMQDVYFRADFVALHARPDPVESLDLPGFHHAAAVRAIPGTDAEDMETPWGYGGPVAADEAAFWRGIGAWRQRQTDRGRIAEFIRLHPFLNPLALRGWLEEVRFDRLTVLVDLGEPAASRRRRYSKGTRYSLHRARQDLSLRKLSAADTPLFKSLYEAGLRRNRASDSYYLGDDYYRDLLAAPWAHAWVAEDCNEALATACFLAGGPFAHYHLSGGVDRARETFAHYLLLEHAIEHFAAEGRRWMHLGGGRGQELGDSLLLFKSRFSPRRVAFYTGGIVFDREAYERLTRGRTDRFLSYRFPPRPVLREEDVTLRPARPHDFPLYFRLKCDVDNIVWSGHGAPPDWSALAPWFRRHVEEDTGRRIFIAECRTRRIGYAYVDDRGGSVEVTIGVATSEAGRGMGRALLRLLTRRLAEEREERRVEAWIFADNRASVRAFEAAGFVRDDGGARRSFEMPLTGGKVEQSCWVLRRRTGEA